MTGLFKEAIFQSTIWCDNNLRFNENLLANITFIDSIQCLEIYKNRFHNTCYKSQGKGFKYPINEMWQKRLVLYSPKLASGKRGQYPQSIEHLSVPP